MSQTKFWSVVADNTVRVTASTQADGVGCGGSKRIVAVLGTQDYKSFLKFDLDWTGVGRVLKATLIVYTDDGVFLETGDTPKAIMRRLLSDFRDGTNADGVFSAADYTKPSLSTTDQKSVSLSAVADSVTRIDITSWVNLWAPTTVKQSNGSAGGNQKHYGLDFQPYSPASTKTRWVGWSNHATNPSLRPSIELVYEEGLTPPNTPTGLTPTGTVSEIDAFEADFSDTRNADTLAYSEVVVYKNDGVTQVWTKKEKASATEIENGRSRLVPATIAIKANTNYKWKVRHYDNQGQVSPYTALTTFQVSNTQPNVPVPTPDGSSYASLGTVLFKGGTFSDPDGDALQAYQVQLSTLAEADPRWDMPEFWLWDTGKVYVPRQTPNATTWQTVYTGGPLDAGAYVWRARHWDRRNGVSDWAYADITLTADFEPLPGQNATVQIKPQTPWRWVFRDMGALRGPGDIIAIIENAKAPGASKMYNSAGEAHFTLPVDHPQISVLEPKQCHYALEFYDGDGWREKFAGLVWDIDATETSVVFYGIDYLGLFNYVYDERYDPANPDKPAASGGSKYVDKTITEIVTDQLDRAIGLTNSIVGFITRGSIATMNEKATIWSTMSPVLNFSAGLIDSHRQGTGKNTRIQVRKTTAGGYEVIVVDDPGTTKDDLRMKYGELVQGYRVIFFGGGWASLQHAIGRTREGIRVLYQSASAPGIDQSIWGRIAQVQVFDGVSDENDLTRRLKQAAIAAGKLGKQIALGIRSGVLMPFDGYDITDHLPVEIIHGAVDTTRFGSGYWTVYGVAWEGGEDGSSTTTNTILPRNDTEAPDPDLIPTAPISPQAEWQLGWEPPDPLQATSKYFLDQNTGDVYERQPDGTYVLKGAAGTLENPPTAPSTPGAPSVTSVVVTDADGHQIIRLIINP